MKPPRLLTAAAWALFGSTSAGCAALFSLDEYTVAEVCPAALTVDPTVAETCVRALSCSPFVPRAKLSICMTYDLFAAHPQIDCLRAATSCSDVAKCTGVGLASAAQCPSGAAEWRCAGSLAVRCSTSGSYTLDCAVLGGQCGTYASSAGGAIDRAGCRVASRCTGSGDSCQGDTLVSCVNGQGFGTACGPQGGACDVVDGQAGCYPATEACSGSTAACTGNVLSLCGGLGHVERFDCGARGHRCVTTTSSEGFCVAPGCPTSLEGECKESCEGSKMSLCVAGVKTTVDCRDYGMSRCRELNDTREGGARALRVVHAVKGCQARAKDSSSAWRRWSARMMTMISAPGTSWSTFTSTVAAAPACPSATATAITPVPR